MDMKKYDMYYKNIAYLESLGNVENQKNYHGKYKNPQIFIKRFKTFIFIYWIIYSKVNS